METRHIRCGIYLAMTLAIVLAAHATSPNAHTASPNASLRNRAVDGEDAAGQAVAAAVRRTTVEALVDARPPAHLPDRTTATSTSSYARARRT